MRPGNTARKTRPKAGIFLAFIVVFVAVARLTPAGTGLVQSVWQGSWSRQDSRVLGPSWRSLRNHRRNLCLLFLCRHHQGNPGKGKLGGAAILLEAGPFLGPLVFWFFYPRFSKASGNNIAALWGRHWCEWLCPQGGLWDNRKNATGEGQNHGHYREIPRKTRANTRGPSI
ncbi:MAG: 4Fe-4S binding protein [Desulfobacterota bacterium U4-17]